MKKLFLILVIFVCVCCKQKPEFYINGKGYYTKKVCISSHIDIKPRYIYTTKQQMQVHYYPVSVCDTYVIDTIEIKQDEKIKN